MLPLTTTFRALSETSSCEADDEMPPKAVENNYKRNRRRWNYLEKHTPDHQLESLHGSWNWMWKNVEDRKSIKLGRAQKAAEKRLNKRRLRRKRRCLERRRKRVTRKGGPGQGRKQIRGMMNRGREIENRRREIVNNISGIVNRIRRLMNHLRELKRTPRRQNHGHDRENGTITIPEYDQGHDRFSTLLRVILWCVTGFAMVILCIILRMVKWAMRAPRTSRYSGRFFSTGMPFRRFFDWLRG